MRVVGAIALATHTALFAASVATAEESSLGLNDSAAAGFVWTGFYAGLNVGWADTHASMAINTDPIPNNALNSQSRATYKTFGTGDADEDTFIAGIQIGYNRQVGNLVLGVEADVDGVSSEMRRDVAGLAAVDAGALTQVTLNDTVDAEFLATVRARLGLAAGRTLIYGTGGVAFTYVDFDRQIFVAKDGCPVGTSPCHVGSDSDFLTGWVVGGGVEHALLSNLTVKVEYLFSQFDDDLSFLTRNSRAPPNITQLLEHSAELEEIQTIRVGINAKY